MSCIRMHFTSFGDRSASHCSNSRSTTIAGRYVTSLCGSSASNRSQYNSILSITMPSGSSKRGKKPKGARRKHAAASNEGSHDDGRQTSLSDHVNNWSSSQWHKPKQTQHQRPDSVKQHDKDVDTNWKREAPMEDSWTHKAMSYQGTNSWKDDQGEEGKSQPLQLASRDGGVAGTPRESPDKWKESHRSTCEDRDHGWLHDGNDRHKSLTRRGDTQWHCEAPREHSWTPGNETDHETTSWTNDEWLDQDSEMQQKKKRKQSPLVTSTIASDFINRIKGERVKAANTSAGKQPPTAPSLQQPRTPPALRQPNTPPEVLSFANVSELDTMRRVMKTDPQLLGLEYIDGYRDNKHMQYLRGRVRQLVTDAVDSRLQSRTHRPIFFVHSMALVIDG